MRCTRRLVGSFAALAALGLTGIGMTALPAAASDLGASASSSFAGELPDTGSNVMGWVIGAIAVLVVGGGLYALSRRRGASTSGDEPPTTPSA